MLVAQITWESLIVIFSADFKEHLIITAPLSKPSHILTEINFYSLTDSFTVDN